MKNAVLAIISLACLAAVPLTAAPSSVPGSGERFYGKITAIDQNQKDVTVHNNKRDSDAHFQWDNGTTVIADRKAIKPTELKVGDSLMISYITENDLNRAQHIMVRHPFKKTQK